MPIHGPDRLSSLPAPPFGKDALTAEQLQRRAARETGGPGTLSPRRPWEGPGVHARGDGDGV